MQNTITSPNFYVIYVIYVLKICSMSERLQIKLFYLLIKIIIYYIIINNYINIQLFESFFAALYCL